MKTIDFRSDTVTKPTQKMRAVMAEADVGDDVYGDDPTVNMLEAYAAELFGFEAALFTPSGTSANLLALLSHCERGDEYIVGQDAHTYKYEGGGAAVLGSIQPQPIEFESDGTLDFDKITKKIKPYDFHFANTRLLCLENSHNGKVLPFDYIKEASKFCHKKGLLFHLDGARLLNASVKSEMKAKDITTLFDSVSICLSKGLGAPVGSILCGNAVFIDKARRWRKVTGGGMRQAGILAAAGLYALENNIDRLADDHKNAEKLAIGLNTLSSHCQVIENPQTNMFFASFRKDTSQQLCDFLKSKNILISAGDVVRLVTHLDITESDIDYTLKQITDFYS